MAYKRLQRCQQFDDALLARFSQDLVIGELSTDGIVSQSEQIDIGMVCIISLVTKSVSNVLKFLLCCSPCR